MRQALSILLLLCSVEASAAVTGRVVDEEGKPVRGARARVRTLETSEQAYLRMLSKEPAPPFFATVETNASGVFQADTKGNAVVELLMDAPGRQFMRREVADGEDAGTFILRTAASRRGRVTAGGRGVAGAVVVVGRSYVTRTDAEGFYETPEPVTGDDRITVIHPGYAIVDRPLRARGSETPMTFDSELEPGTVLRGRVVDAAGKGVANAVVHASGWPLARTGEDGSFEIAHAATATPPLFAREGNRVGSLITERAKPPYVIRLRPAALVAGAVRSSKDETPVAGARVTIRADFDEAAWPSTISDAKGNFLIDGIEAGQRRLAATHPVFQGGGASEVRLEEGARVNRIISITPIARLAGKIVDEDQRPIAAATVRIVGGGGSVISAPDGSFSLKFPAVDRALSIWVMKPPYPVATFGPYSIQPGETKGGLLFRIPRGIRFELRLVDRDGAPVAGEPLTLMRKTDPEVRHSRAPVPCGGSETTQCRTDDQGRLALTLTEGEYDISAGGLATVRRELLDQLLTARQSPMTLELERGAVVEGRVVWSDGTPANIRATVFAQSHPGASALVQDGAFVLRNVPAGKVSLSVDTGPPSHSRSEPVEVTAPASGVALMMQRAGRIEGRVADRATDKPLREFSVTLHPTRLRTRSVPPKTFESEDGRFVLEDVAPGTYYVNVHAPGYARTNSEQVTVEEAKTASAQVQLDRGGIVVGRVTAEGRALANAQVMVAFSRETRADFTPQQTDANGDFTIDGLPAGSHKLDVRRQGYVPKQVSVTVTAARETRADVELSRGHELRGRVLDTSGRPMPMAEISVRGSTSAAMSSPIITTDADGAFRLTGLGDATYKINAQKEGYAESYLEVNPATTNDITLTLSRGGTITGRVLGLPPSEMPFVQVRAYGVRHHAQPDAAGAFTLTGVPDGDITVMATLSRPRRREIKGPIVKVVNGVAPPVDLDFNAGIAVRGRVTHRGQNVEGNIMFRTTEPTGPSGSGPIAPDGTYDVRLSAPGEYQVSVARHGFGGFVNAGRVNVTGEMVHDVELRGIALSGVVADAMTRAPIAGASVVMMPGTDVRTNGAGRFTFDLVADGEYKLRASADGYAPEARALSIQNNFAPEMELLLSRGVAAMFRVIDKATGRSPEHIMVMVNDKAKSNVFHGTPDADAAGVRSIMLQPGTYELRVFGDPYAAKTVTLTVPGPVVDVVVEPRP